MFSEKNNILSPAIPSNNKKEGLWFISCHDAIGKGGDPLKPLHVSSGTSAVLHSAQDCAPRCLLTKRK